jgi:hypothetical protein
VNPWSQKTLGKRSLRLSFFSIEDYGKVYAQWNFMGE